jgi:hypothetical protein
MIGKVYRSFVGNANYAQQNIIGSAISFVIVYAIGSFVTPWLKLLGQLLPWLSQMGRSEGKAY